MELILWRHAEAAEGMPDLKRRLTPRGRKHAARVAAWLLQRLPAKFGVLASPAERTRETALALGVSFKTSDDLLPGATAEAAVRAMDWPARSTAFISSKLFLTKVKRSWDTIPAARTATSICNTP